MESQLKAPLLFRLDGSVLDQGVPLHVALDGLNNLQSIFDKAFLTLSNKQRITPELRQEFQIISEDFRKGSLEFWFTVMLAGGQLGFEFMSLNGPGAVWSYVKESWDFLKLIFRANREGEAVQITIGDVHIGDVNNNYIALPNSTMTVVTGDQKQEFRGPVYNIGRQSVTNYQRLTKMVENHELRSVECGSKGEPEIKIGESEVGLFDGRKTIDDTPVAVEVDIYRFHKYNNSGRLTVPPGQEIPSGDYPFSLVGDQDNADYIESMLNNSSRLKCLIERGISPFGKQLVTRLLVIGIAA